MGKDDKRAFIDILRDYLKMGFTQVELSLIVGVAQSTMSGWLNDSKPDMMPKDDMVSTYIDRLAKGKNTYNKVKERECHTDPIQHALVKIIKNCYELGYTTDVLASITCYTDSTIRKWATDVHVPGAWKARDAYSKLVVAMVVLTNGLQDIVVPFDSWKQIKSLPEEEQAVAFETWKPPTQVVVEEQKVTVTQDVTLDAVLAILKGDSCRIEDEIVEVTEQVHKLRLRAEELAKERQAKYHAIEEIEKVKKEILEKGAIIT